LNIIAAVAGNPTPASSLPAEMVTAEEIGEVGAFAALDTGEREQLSRVAADIGLVSGEYAANEGDERASFAVLDGRIEAVKAVDGVERVVGERLPGDVFGEVPIVLGTVFPVGFRAAEKSRVMRIEPHDYRTLVVEREAPGGQAGTSSRIENYLGFPSGVSGDELASRALQQARRLGAEILVTRSIDRIDTANRQLHLDAGDVIRARTIILACGVTWRHLQIEGFDRLTGKGVFYGAARSEAPNTHGLDVHIVGAGNSAGQAALFFSTHARSVTILARGERLEKSMSRYLVDQLGTWSNIEVMFGTEIAAVHGESSLEAIEVRNGTRDGTSRIDSGGLFIFIGADAETAWLPSEIELDRRGFVLTGPDVGSGERWALDRDPYLLETSVPGIFACGDVRFGPVKRVAAAVGEGSMAIAFVHQYLKDLEPPG